MNNNDTALTIFDHLDRTEVQQAIKNLIKGTTPRKEVRQRPVGGGGTVMYVNTYYMTRQISLITGFRWSSECLEEKIYPASGEPRELGAKMKVTIWDKHGNQFSHVAWGCAELKRNVSYFDQWKAAYSDGIKKCLSYFGIANDVYGGRDLQYFGEEPPDTSESTVNNSRDDRNIFMAYLRDKHILPSKAMQTLGISSWNEITDWREAFNRLTKGGDV